MAKKQNNELGSALIYIVIGVLLIVFKEQMLGWAMTIAGVFFVISGALDIIRQNFAGGAISLIIGIAILVLGRIAVDIVLLVLGILIAVKGVIALLAVFKRTRNNVLRIIFPILTIAVGLMLAFGNGLGVMIVITGVLLTIDGAIGLIGAMKK